MAKWTNDRKVALTFFFAMTLDEGPYILLLTTQRFCLRLPRYGWNSSNISTSKYMLRIRFYYNMGLTYEKSIILARVEVNGRPFWKQQTSIGFRKMWKICWTRRAATTISIGTLLYKFVSYIFKYWKCTEFVCFSVIVVNNLISHPKDTINRRGILFNNFKY